MRRGTQEKQETQACLTTALMKLSAKKPYSSINISELCEVAGVSRMAFYRNFSSKEDILSAHLGEVFEQYRVATKACLLSGELWCGMGHLAVCFRFLKENAEFINCLYRCGFAQHLLEAIAAYDNSIWGDGTPETEYILVGFAGLICATYQKWAQNGFKESPRSMAALVSASYKMP